jgi:tetratricopeptide (TPR) repeat protein
MQIGRGPAVHVRRFAAATPDAVRPSNPAVRDRAAKLVATGDQHLRAALADRTKLQRALDAYRRAEKIAADQPDTLLRQAIVLTALDRADDAQAAVKRAIAIDGRLAEDSAPAVAAADQPPPDPVFGDRPLGSPTLLAERSAGLIGGIFWNDAGDVGGPNWIADRWSRRWHDGRGLIAAK